MSEQISGDIGALLKQLAVSGFTVQSSSYDAAAFGDYVVKLTRGSVALSLVRDRRQYYVDGDMDSIREQGLFRAFDSRDDFSAAVLRYVNAVV